MKKRDTGELFEVFSDPRPGGSAAHRGEQNLGEGFRKFLEERGEYPFRDEAKPFGFQIKRLLNFRAEALLVVALAFLITNIASFSVGVWNGKRGVASAQTSAEEKPAANTQKLPDVAPKVVSDPVPVVPPAPVRPAPSPSSPATAVPAEGAYTIRVASLGLGQAKEAQEILKFFEGRGYKPSRVRTVGSNLVIEVGAFPSTRDNSAQRALKDIQRARYKFTKFGDAFFIRR